MYYELELLSSLRRQRLGRLSFRLNFLSESISQKLSKASIWNLEYLFTIKRGTNSNKMMDGVVFSCQQIGVNTFYKCIEFQVNSFDSYWEILINTLVESVDPFCWQ
jgi:hypothetical protein